MKKGLQWIAILAFVTLTSCDDSTEPDVGEQFVAQLTGAGEVPARTTTASGSAVFELNRAGTELRYTLTINGLTGFTMAHIHTGAADVNGPIVVFLFGPHGAPGVTVPNVVKTGVITSADINPQNFQGTLADLLEQMRAGGTYVNAHTTTFTGGEIRGQIAVDD